MAAIFDFRHTQTSDSIATCLFVLLDPENMGIAVEISFPCCLQAEIMVLPVRSLSNIDSPFGLLDLENIVIAVGISFLSYQQAEIEVYLVLEATILDFSLPVKSYYILGSSII